MSSPEQPPAAARPLNDRLQSLVDELRDLAAPTAANAPRVDRAPVDAPPVEAPAAGRERDPAKMAAAEPSLPRRLGDYELLDVIAVSKTTITYRARQVGLERMVAVKSLLRDALCCQSEVQCFQSASESAAKLDHPGIVPIYEVGWHEGLPFYSMPYIEGESLVDLITRRGPLELSEALLLVRDVSLALDYAHQSHVLHGCLTASKVLLDETRRVPSSLATDPSLHSNLIPRIIDFGLATRCVVAEGQMSSQQNMQTPNFKSSCKVTGQIGELDTAADVSSLQEILYYAITGCLISQNANPLAMRQSLFKLNTILSSELTRLHSQADNSDVFEIGQGELPQHFASAHDVAEALNNNLERLSAIRIKERIRRRPVWQSTALCSVASAVVMALYAIGVFLYLFVLDPSFAQKQRKVRRSQDCEWSAYISQLRHSQIEWHAERLNCARKLLATCPLGLRNWEWTHLNQCSDWEELTCLSGENVVHSVAFDIDRSRIVAFNDEMTVGLWGVVGGRDVATLNCNSPIAAIKWNTSDRESVVRFKDRRISTINIVLGDCRSLSSIHRNSTEVGVFYRNGSRFVVGDDKAIYVFNVLTDELISTLSVFGGAVSSIAIDPTGRLLAAANAWGEIGIWEIESGRQVRALYHSSLDACRIAFVSGGRGVAGAGKDGICRVWDVESGEVILSFKRHDAPIGALEVSLDGEWAVSGSDDGVVCVWETNSGELVRRWRAHEGPVSSVSLRRGGSELLTCSLGEPVKVWRLDARVASRRSESHSARVHEVAFSPEGGWVASASGDGSVRVWDAGTVEREQRFVGHQGEVLAVAFGPEGKWLASSGEDGTIRRWDARSGKPRGEPLRNASPVNSMAVARRQAPVACGGEDGSISLWDVVGGRTLRSFAAHAGAVRCVRFSPDDRLLASCGDDGAVRVWNVDSRTLWKTLGQHPGRAWHVAFSPDGDRLASTGDGGVVRIWELATGRLLLACAGHDGAVHGAAFSPDGARLVTAGRDGTLKVWETDGGREVLTLDGHRGAVDSCQFSPDGLTVASAGADGRVRLWRAGRGR